MFVEGSYDEEIENRIGAALKVIGAIRSEVLGRTELSNDIKLTVYIQCNGGVYVTVRV